jgi:hypothetical protein
MKRVAELGNVDAAFESYISEKALAASFNNKYIMGKTKYSYSDSIMNLIDEFGDTLKVTYPITAQLAPGENADGAKVLQLNNKKEAQGELASIYYNNLRSLSDPSIMKVENVSDNNRISEMFNLFSLMMFYQHGIGNTKLGFTKVLDPIQYKAIMQAASTNFINNYLNEDTLNTIFNTVVSMDRFKNHLTSPEGYRHADIAKIAEGNTTENGTDEVEESFDEDEGENLVLVRLINQEDVDLFNQAVDRAKGKKPERWFTGKTLFPAFYNSATGKREGMPQSAIWIKNKYGNYDMVDQDPNNGEVYYQNVNLATGMYKVSKDETEQKPTEGPAKLSTQSTGFQGYKGGFENVGKGTPQGDGKDKAMREVAGGFILELDPKRENDSSTGTTAKEYPNYREGVMVSSKNFYNDVVMLARNNEFKNKPLSEDTKRSILDAHDEGISFVVGDMPGVDSQFIDYLQEIGAKFTVYHTGNTPRIQITQPTVEPVGEVKEGVSEVFKSNPELASVGTPEQYSQYLNTIFPESKVKDIVYHGTPDGQFESFDVSKAGKTTYQPTEAIYFTSGKRTADFYAEGSVDFSQFESREEYEAVKTAKVFSVILNAKELKLVDNPQAQSPEGDAILRTKNKIVDNGIVDSPEYAHQYIVFNPNQIYILGGKQDIEGFKQFVSTQPTETKVEQPELNDSIEKDMKIYAYLLKERGGVQPQYFKAGPNENRVYNLNKFGNYDLIDATTGEIYVRNINMETGKQETEPFLDAPVSQEVIQRELNRIITLRAETNIEEQLAGLGYDINDIINNLANAKTQEDLNKITKILDKLC